MSKTTEKQEVTIANLLNDVLVYYVNYLDAKDSEELKTGYENARTHIIAEFTALQARCEELIQFIEELGRYAAARNLLYDTALDMQIKCMQEKSDLTAEVSRLQSKIDELNGLLAITK